MNQQNFLYPNAPGVKEKNGTSQEAADKIKPILSKLQKQVFNEIKRIKGTPDEVAERLGMDILVVRPRFTELQKPEIDLIEKTGVRRPNRKGNNQWEFRAK